MKKITLIITAILIFAFAGCTATREANSNANANANAAANTNANAASVTNSEDAKPADTTAAADPSMESPTATMNTFIEALKKKDGETIKKTLSKSSLVALGENAKAANMTVDQMIIEGEDMSKEKTPAMRNEKIEGDTATLEVEDERAKKWDTIPFVKEDGNWKIAFDKIEL